MADSGYGRSSWGMTLDINLLYTVALESVSRALGNPGGLMDRLDLEFLRPSLSDLRTAYQKGAMSFEAPRINYSDDIVLAYLAAYVPGYVKLSERAIRSSIAPGDFDISTRIAAIGCGPCPEVIALVSLLGRRHHSPRKLDMHLFDYNHEGWSSARRAVLDSLRHRFPNVIVKITEHHIDLTQPMDQSLIADLPIFDLCIGQNFLNEVQADTDTAVNNLKAIGSRLRIGRNLVITDQWDSATQTGMTKLRDAFRDGWSTHEIPQETLKFPWPQKDRFPAYWTLLNESGGLIPRGRINFHGLRATRVGEEK